MVRFKTLKHKKIEIVMHLVQDCDQGLLLKLCTYATNSTTTNDKFVHSSKKSAKEWRLQKHKNKATLTKLLETVEKAAKEAD